MTFFALLIFGESRTELFRASFLIVETPLGEWMQEIEACLTEAVVKTGNLVFHPALRMQTSSIHQDMAGGLTHDAGVRCLVGLITPARSGFQAAAVENRDGAAAIVDQFAFLQ